MSAEVNWSPLLKFVEVENPQPIDEEAVIAQAKAELTAQNEAKVKHQIMMLAHDKTLFTEEGKFGKLPPEQQLELLVAVMDFLQDETTGHIIDYQHSDYLEGIDWDDVNDYIRIAHLVNAAKNSVFLTDWKHRIEQIQDAYRYYPGRYSARVVGFREDAVQEAAAQIGELSEGLPEGLTGEGIEFAPGVSGTGKRIYMDGQLVVSLSGANFGSNPTNGEIVAWLTIRQIDSCRIKGDQMMWEVFAWKKGDEEPRRIFEDHNYRSEGPLSLGRPNVEADGTIVFTHCTSESTIEKRIKL